MFKFICLYMYVYSFIVLRYEHESVTSHNLLGHFDRPIRSTNKTNQHSDQQTDIRAVTITITTGVDAFIPTPQGYKRRIFKCTKKGMRSLVEKRRN